MLIPETEVTPVNEQQDAGNNAWRKAKTYYWLIIGNVLPLLASSI